MSISVKNITKIYGTQKALDAVSLEIKPGEIVGLLGPNGAGKSTLMKILTCFIPPTSGEASVCDFDVLEQSLEVRKRVGYLPENNPLYLDLYVKEFLEFISGTHKKTVNRKSKIENRIAEIIELTGLTNEQHKKIGALSRGYRQRVGIAQALLHDPEVLILDEPTSGLDPNQLIEIRTLIQTIGKEKTVLLSTHIMQEVEAVCQKAIIINNGIIVADGPTEIIRNSSNAKTLIEVEFGSEVTAKQLQEIKGVVRAYPSLEGTKGSLTNIWLLESINSFDIRPEVFNFAVKNKLTVLSLKKVEQKLESVFQELTKGK